MTTATCEVWLIVDEDGDYACGRDRDSAEEQYRDEIGTEPGSCLRVIRLMVDVPVPKPTEVSCTLPEDAAGEIAVKVGG